ncbi:hypothetical protein BB560_001018 [Smittium megazygosporum]|uniref:Uncharacterized protein n=1 Tax=Smittium megazygosporum TaxID=133381 RepID=A0A2T9ZIS1_9FUNG|nr:hypothetical protein BB560_001018 [Smittium megazygosporum]
MEADYPPTPEPSRISRLAQEYLTYRSALDDIWHGRKMIDGVTTYQTSYSTKEEEICLKIQIPFGLSNDLCQGCRWIDSGMLTTFFVEAPDI